MARTDYATIPRARRWRWYRALYRVRHTSILVRALFYNFTLFRFIGLCRLTPALTVLNSPDTSL